MIINQKDIQSQPNINKSQVANQDSHLTPNVNLNLNAASLITPTPSASLNLHHQEFPDFVPEVTHNLLNIWPSPTKPRTAIKKPESSKEAENQKSNQPKIVNEETKIASVPLKSKSNQLCANLTSNSDKV